MIARRSAWEATAKPAENVGATSPASSAFKETKKEALCIVFFKFLLPLHTKKRIEPQIQEIREYKTKKNKNPPFLKTEKQKWSLKSR